MDNTLAVYHESFISHYNSLKGTNYKISDMGSYEPEGWKFEISIKEFLDMHHLIWTTDWKSIKPSITPDILGELENRYDVRILSKVSKRHKPFMVQWMNFYFPETKIKIECVNSVEEKLVYNCNFYFDDANPFAEAFAMKKNNDSILFLIESPWNKDRNYGRMNSNIIQVKDLETGIKRLIRG